MPAPRVRLLLFFVVLTFSMNAQISCDWLGHFGGSGLDEATATCFDNDGNFYVAGTFKSTFVLGTKTLEAVNHSPIFIAKYSPSKDIIWAIQSNKLGDSSRSASVAGICADTSGNIYITGKFSTAIKLDPDLILTSAGNADIYIAKLNSSGTCEWLKQVSGAANEVSTGICIGTDNSPVVCGYFEGSSNLLGTNITSVGNSDVLVAKVNSNGVLLHYARFGSSGQNRGNAICSLAQEGYVICGYYQSSIAIGGTTLSEGGQEAFICKLDNSLNPLWAIGSSGTGSQNATNICANDSSIFVAGSYSAAISFPGYSLPNAGNALYAAKLDYAGNYVWLSSLGYSTVSGNNITGAYMDSSSQLHLAGYFNLNFSVPNHSITPTGNFDVLLMTLTENGMISFAAAYGGSGEDKAMSICGTPNGTMLLAGSFSATATIAGNSYTSAGQKDVFALLFHDLDSTIPAAPENVSLVRVGGNLLLSWSAVTTSEAGSTLSVSGYNIYSSASPDDRDLQPCGQCTETNFTISPGDSNPQHNFFRVKAYR